MLIFISVIFAAVIAATAAPIITRREKRELPGERVRVREIGITALLGAMLWLEAAVILYYGYTQPQSLITSSRALVNMVIFLVLSIFLGAFMQLYYFVKCTIATDTEVLGVTAFGQRTALKWAEIDSLKLTTGKRLTMLDRSGTRKITAGGEKMEYRRFVKFASGKIPEKAGKEELRKLKNSLKL